MGLVIAEPITTKETLEDLVKYIRANAPSMAIMADCDNLESAAEADRLGFDYIGTTMRGYPQATRLFCLCPACRRYVPKRHTWEVV